MISHIVSIYTDPLVTIVASEVKWCGQYWNVVWLLKRQLHMAIHLIIDYDTVDAVMDYLVVHLSIVILIVYDSGQLKPKTIKFLSM